MSAENWVIMSELDTCSISAPTVILDTMKAILPVQFWTGTAWVMNEAQKAKWFPSKEAADIEAVAAALILPKGWLIGVVTETAIPAPPAVDTEEVT